MGNCNKLDRSDRFFKCGCDNFSGQNNSCKNACFNRQVNCLDNEPVFGSLAQGSFQPIGITGATGAIGVIGATGAIGAIGPTGPTGPTGPMGPAGPVGLQGPVGNRGATGATGSQGPQGVQGIQGVRGATGATGVSGVTGVTGVTGANGMDGSTAGVLYLHNIGDGYFAPGEAVTFAQPAVPAFPILGMSCVSPAMVNLTAPGIYNVEYMFRPQNAHTALALFLDNHEIPGSRYESLSASETLMGRASFILSPSDVPANLTLRNVHPTQQAVLDPGSLSNVVAASMKSTAIIY